MTHTGQTGTGKGNPPLRVLLLTHYFPAHRGGIEIVAGQLAARLLESCTIQWLAADCDPPPVLPGLICTPQRAWNGLEGKGLPWPLWTPSAWQTLRHALADCDIVHIHDFIYPAHLVALPLARHLGKPVVLTQHIGDIEYNSVVLRNILKGVNRSFGRWMLGHASQVVFISPRVQASFETYTRFSRPPLYWPNGVDTGTFRALPRKARLTLRQAYGLTPERPVLLFVGRFVERKGLHLLRRLAAARPGWQWCFAGWGPLDPRDWELPNVQVYTGLQGASLAPLYQLADLLVLPSHGEGFPLVVQESLACGTPAIISEETAAGGPEIPGCIVATPYMPQRLDPAIWLETITEALEADDFAERRQNCAEEACRRWSWDRLAENYRGLFERLLAQD